MAAEKLDCYLHKNNFLLWIALKHHKTHKHKPLDFANHQYLKQIYSDNSDYIIIVKSTQCGITEYLIVRAMAKAINGQSIFYVLPTYTLVNRFVRNRIDKSILNTPYYHGLSKIAKEEDSRRSESMTLKDIGLGNVAFVGSNSTAGFTEYPADEIIIDEMDECDQDNIKMAWERLSASEFMTQIKVANPTIEGYGIDAEYAKTNQMEWFIKHDCGNWIKLDWFKHIVKEIDNGRYMIRDQEWEWDSGRDIYPICDKCNKPIVDRKQPGWWVAKTANNNHGYRVTKLFSGNVSIVQMLDRFQDGLVKDIALQRFYNADLGQAFTASGTKITRKMIEDCVGDYSPGPEDGLCLAGIDVGTFYNYVIKKIMPGGTLKTLAIGKVRDTEEMINVLREYKISAGIIDAGPETREAKKIISKFKLLFGCYFGNVKSDKIDFQGKTVTVQRTPALDAVKESLLTNTIIYPKNILGDQEFINQMTASVRVYNPERKVLGSAGAYEWTEGSKADHYMLATAYCLIARRLVILLQKR